MRIFFILLILLSACKANSKEDLTRLIKDLSSPDGKVRNSSALEIANYGKDGAPAVPALIKLLNTDKSRGIRTSAAYALRAIGTDEAKKALDNYSE